MAPPVGQLLLVLLVLEARYFGAKMTMDAIAQLQQHPNKLQSAPAGRRRRQDQPQDASPGQENDEREETAEEDCQDTLM